VDLLLQINEIVSGPIKDLLVEVSGGNFPDIKLPEINFPEVPPLSSPTYPENISLEIGGSSFENLGSSEQFNGNGSSEFFNDAGSSELLNDLGSSDFDLFNGDVSPDFLNDFNSSDLDLSALGSLL
jgi:hypothetical protein